MINNTTIKKKLNIQKVGAGTWENRFFAYNGCGDKVKIFKIVKQIQTNDEQHKREKKKVYQKYLDK
jgi:hypothetical protein